MYLSCLLIDVGSNPDRPRPGRLWLRNLYRVHQRLCMAFPSPVRKKCDPDFLAPYAPDDFPEQRHLADKNKAEVEPDVLKQVHSKRSPDSGFLFRIDSQTRCEAHRDRDNPGARVVILVQSALEPYWEYAFHNASYLLAAPAQTKQFDPCFMVGQRLRFRLVANPIRRLSKHSLGADGQPIQKGIGKRVPVPANQLFDWLTRRAEPAGFSVASDSVTIQPGYIYMNKTRNNVGIRLRSVRYDGVLNVTDPKRLREAMIEGIGPGKAFGFGLLSVAPCHKPLAVEST